MFKKGSERYVADESFSTTRLIDTIYTLSSVSTKLDKTLDLVGFKTGSAGSLTPQKKMKKRKELNALIGLGDSKRKKTKKGSGHRLLRTEPPDSESESSSDDDEFSNMGTVAAFGKRSYTKCCSVCYPLLLFIILAACVMACAGLIWMQIALKEDLDSMKEKMRTMESSQKASAHEIPKLSEELKTKQRKLDEIESGDKGLSKLWSNLTEMNRKISLLDSAVNHLKANIKSASDLINLPNTVEELQKSVATIGSTLTSVQHDVKTMQSALENQKTHTDDLKKTTDITDLKEAVTEVNRTQELYESQVGHQIHSLISTVSNLSQRLYSLEHGPEQETLTNVSMGETGHEPSIASHAAGVVDDATKTEASPDTANEQFTPVSGSKQERRRRFLTPKHKRNVGPRSLKPLSSPSGVSSQKDPEDLF